jgi:hypothetical protein
MNDWDSSGAFLLHLCAILLVLCLAYHFLIGKYVNFTIRLRKGRVICKGAIPLAKRQGMAEFLAQDLALQGTITILGSRDKRGLKLWFLGRLSAAEKQRIRNFLAAG